MAIILDVNKCLDKKLDKISGAGTVLGRIVGAFGRTTTKVLIGVGLLFIFGIAVFIWSFVQGMGKKK
jgi:hypothetical protein